MVKKNKNNTPHKPKKKKTPEREKKIRFLSNMADTMMTFHCLWTEETKN